MVWTAVSAVCCLKSGLQGLVLSVDRVDGSFEPSKSFTELVSKSAVCDSDPPIRGPTSQYGWSRGMSGAVPVSLTHDIIRVGQGALHAAVLLESVENQDADGEHRRSHL